MYVDGLWVKREEGSAATVQAVVDEITTRTGLPIALEGIYRFVAFLPSQLDERIPVANRYYCVFQDGSFKIRGIEARRHDTPPFIARVQSEILQQLADAEPNKRPEVRLPAIVMLLRQRLADLRFGRVGLADLLVTQRVSRVLEEYRVSSPAARALERLETEGKQLRPGQYIRFLYTRGEPGVYAWNLSLPPDPDSIDTQRNSDLLIRAASNMLQPFVDETRLRS